MVNPANIWRGVVSLELHSSQF